mmetsp:Transcript_35079/g.87926  ORF Transcript_35079/g.87926 Transcript_35079/m.87926 type:complete len:226 (+) Transcript_35079:101-778(+)
MASRRWSAPPWSACSRRRMACMSSASLAGTSPSTPPRWPPPSSVPAPASSLTCPSPRSTGSPMASTAPSTAYFTTTSSTTWASRCALPTCRPSAPRITPSCTTASSLAQPATAWTASTRASTCPSCAWATGCCSTTLVPTPLPEPPTSTASRSPTPTCFTSTSNNISRYSYHDQLSSTRRPVIYKRYSAIHAEPSSSPGKVPIMHLCTQGSILLHRQPLRPLPAA